MSLATLDIQQGKYQDAVDALHEILQECRVLKDHYDFGLCIYRLCISLLYLGDYEQLKIYSEEGRSTVNVQRNYEVIATCTLCLGHVHLHKRAFSDAEVLFRQALSILEEAGDSCAIIDAKFSMAQLLFEKGDKGRPKRPLKHF